MQHKSIPLLFLLLLIAASPTAGQIDNPDMSVTIDSFVAKLYPKGSHYFWVINDATPENRGEMIVDINAIVPDQAEKVGHESRFLLLLVRGELFAAQRVPLGADIDCRPEEKEI